MRENSVPEAMRELVEKIDHLPEVELETLKKVWSCGFQVASFQFGQRNHQSGRVSLLKKIGGLIRQLPNRVRIEGHTDNVPISTAMFPSNWELSAARAVNIVKFLSDHMGVYPRRLSAVGYGASRPIKANDTPENRAMNRRVEIDSAEGKGKIRCPKRR
jgi:flagellar motor protein MotB